MFGSKKIEELEARVRELTESLSKQQAENAELTQQLDSAKGRIADMEAQLMDFDLAQAKEEARASRAEFEGLKDLYTRKNREFDEYKEEEEQRFARDQALQRHNLENEIRDNRQANQEYVANTVKTFGESYNYYLNQIKVLMDALGNVATRTGAALFSGENADLRNSFGHQMRDLLKSGVDAFGDEGEDLVVEAEDVPEVVDESADAEKPLDK
jgi:chromosome segregation ATPase